jgi:hypothetical protein
VFTNINDDCMEGFSWPPHASIDLAVRDSDGSVVYRTTTRANAAGHFDVGNNGAERCDVPVDLRPGMKVTASDGNTTKDVVLERITFDQLDPVTTTAAGTAPSGPVDVFVYWNGLNSSVDAHPVAGPGGDWFVDVGALGGKIEAGSMGDVFVFDADKDATSADHFVTTVSLGASAPAGAASHAVVVTPGSRVRLSGRLSAGTRACVKRKRVKLLQIAGGATKVLGSARTNRTGRYSFVRKVERTTSFRVRYGGNARCQRSNSRLRLVRVAKP